MKAAVLYGKDQMPQCVEIPEPKVSNEGEVLVRVKAVAIKHLDKGRARGTHYSSVVKGKGDVKEGRMAGVEGNEETDLQGGEKELVPGGEKGEEQGREKGDGVIGGDGVCLLPDGTRVYALGASGMMAERAIVEKDRIVPLPLGLDDATAAALPNAVIGAAMALRFRAGLEKGDTVLINGATGFTGRVAVQIARHYGAGHIIATGRNPASLAELKALGADEVVSLAQADEALSAQLREIHQRKPINVIIDYLWGHTAEIILPIFKGNGSFTPRTRYVSVGSMAGDLVRLSAANLRSVDLQLSGSGLGSWTRAQVRSLFTEILPEMFALADKGALRVETVNVKLEDIDHLWDAEVENGKRLVVLI